MESYIVTDLGYGDAGKGTVVDYLSRRARSSVVVRHCGGPQAAHNVVTSDGRHHTFAQWGSGTFNKAPTLLSHYMFINPVNMLREAAHLQAVGVNDPFSLLYVDSKCPVITPWHKEANQARERSRGACAHGSCGQGVGELAGDMQAGIHQIVAANLRDWVTFKDKFEHCRAVKMQQLRDDGLLTADLAPLFYRGMRDVGSLMRQTWEAGQRLTLVDEYLFIQRMKEATFIFEGSQGVLLDEYVGFDPYTTWTNTTPTNALVIHDDSPDLRNRKVVSIGVTRSYMTRHGFGPFVSEDFDVDHDEPHNTTGKWMGAFRRGNLDTVALRYAVNACNHRDAPITTLALTHADRIAPYNKVCTRYEDDTHRALLYPASYYGGHYTALCRNAEPQYSKWSGDNFIDLLEHRLGLPVSLVSWGPTAEQKRSTLFGGVERD